MNADGTGLARLSPRVNETVVFGSEFSPPAWSPDGDLVAYSQQSTTSPSHVVVVPAAGGAVRELSGMEGSDWGPAWSPDATSIAWRRAPTIVDFGHFVIARLDGSQQRFLAPRVAGSPTWSPDGTQLIGLADRALTGQVDTLVVIDIAYGSFVELPAEPSGKPSWQWLPPR
jgi:Tol biopolymer transport system component